MESLQSGKLWQKTARLLQCKTNLSLTAKGVNYVFENFDHIDFVGCNCYAGFGC
jgi:hypothetical protein